MGELREREREKESEEGRYKGKVSVHERRMRRWSGERCARRWCARIYNARAALE